MSCSRKNCGQNNTKTPLATDIAAMQAAGIDLLNYLLEVSRGGLPTHVTRLIGVTTFQNPAIRELANKISTLVTENEYLKKIAGAVTPAKFQVIDSTLEIAFGPDLSYVLKIPVTTVRDREQVIAELTAAIARLQADEPVVVPAQQTFSFMAANAQDHS